MSKEDRCRKNALRETFLMSFHCVLCEKAGGSLYKKFYVLEKLVCDNLRF